MNSHPEIIVIGGSSGSIPVLTHMLQSLPDSLSLPVIIVIHRLKNVDSTLRTILSATKNISEPEDKDIILPGHIYLAPQNYHLLVEEDKTMSMDYSELVNYSRPSIDVTFGSVASVYQEGVVGILLSGANKDGAEGISEIIQRGGIGIVQDPSSAGSRAMPESAILLNSKVAIMSPEQIINKILEILNQ